MRTSYRRKRTYRRRSTRKRRTRKSGTYRRTYRRKSTRKRQTRKRQTRQKGGNRYRNSNSDHKGDSRTKKVQEQNNKIKKIKEDIKWIPQEITRLKHLQSQGLLDEFLEDELKMLENRLASPDYQFYLQKLQDANYKFEKNIGNEEGKQRNKKVSFPYYPTIAYYDEEHIGNRKTPLLRSTSMEEIERRAEEMREAKKYAEEEPFWLQSGGKSFFTPRRLQ